MRRAALFVTASACGSSTMSMPRRDSHGWTSPSCQWVVSSPPRQRPDFWRHTCNSPTSTTRHTIVLAVRLPHSVPPHSPTSPLPLFPLHRPRPHLAMWARLLDSLLFAGLLLACFAFPNSLLLTPSLPSSCLLRACLLLTRSFLLAVSSASTLVEKFLVENLKECRSTCHPRNSSSTHTALRCIDHPP